MRHRLMMIFAHPDDESFGFAGTASALSDAGHEVSYVVATRGEVGEILVEGLATRETLGEVREGELRTALEIIGVRDLHLLGFREKMQTRVLS
jgi:LmbE family N-acetylglucosaminyl deacetylase